MGVGMAIMIHHSPPCLQDIFHRGLVPCTPRKLQKGEFLWRSDDSHPYCYLIGSGLIKLCVQTADGRERTLLFYTRGAFFGIQYWSGAKKTYTSAIAMLPTSLYAAEPERVSDFILASPQLARALTGYLVHHIYAEAREIVDFSSSNTDEKLAALLVILAEEYLQGRRGEALIPLKNDELANLVGACRNSVYNVLCSFQKRNLVRKQRGHVAIIDVDRLRDFQRALKAGDCVD